jgi:type III pantothenate kinase
MKRLLAVDIGNTNITFGLFGTWGLERKAKVPTHRYAIYPRRLAAFTRLAPRRAVVSSVVPLALSRVIACLAKLGVEKIDVVGRDILVPIPNLYRRPREVGQDRLVNAFAASGIYGVPAVVVDFGTAVTFDVVSRKGEYLGGLIMPGIEMGLRSLYERTALLPRVELARARHIIGKDTVDSIRGGILFGYGALVDALAQRYRKILGARTKIVATGGNAGLIKMYSGSIDTVDEDLTLKGLAALDKAYPL